jgi:hypothetical protein
MRRFEDTEDIKRNVTKELLALHENEFENVPNNFVSKHKSMRHLKEIIFKNIERYVRF